jgi:hypothetical protein
MERRTPVQLEIEAPLLAHTRYQVQSQSTLIEKGFPSYITHHIGAALTRDWDHALLGRHLDARHIGKPIRQEDQRLMVLRAFPEEDSESTVKHDQPWATELEFNLDEVDTSH